MADARCVLLSSAIGLLQLNFDLNIRALLILSKRRANKSSLSENAIDGRSGRVFPQESHRCKFRLAKPIVDLTEIVPAKRSTSIPPVPVASTRHRIVDVPRQW